MKMTQCDNLPQNGQSTPILPFPNHISVLHPGPHTPLRHAWFIISPRTPPAKQRASPPQLAGAPRKLTAPLARTAAGVGHAIGCSAHWSMQWTLQPMCLQPAIALQDTTISTLKRLLQKSSMCEREKKHLELPDSSRWVPSKACSRVCFPKRKCEF